eukprot:TRINITY_DN4095_c0_g1_i15.p1 TRINITY_DN4095_c0_g1~~TRINITY_DN4095_c0_g1_i15.p1  ORF type:complete len:361 (+),score=35.98 TRINITY_DN4095_c0_g1_i15:69-1151(+)
MYLFVLLLVLPFSFSLRVSFEAEGRIDTRWKYNGFLNIELQSDVWSISAFATEFDAHIPNNRVQYYYHDGKAVKFQQNKYRCMPSNQVPPLHDLQTAIQEGTEILRFHFNYSGWNSFFSRTEIRSLSESCPESGHVIQIPFAGEYFLLCVNSNKSQIISALGSQFHVRFVPQPEQENKLLFSSSVYRSLLTCPRTTYQIPLSVPSQWWKISQVKRQATIPRCIFVHGSGVQEAGNLTTNFTYWGNIQDFTTQCESHLFLHMNTFDNGWDYLPNQQEVCRVALDGKDVIEDTVCVYSLFPCSVTYNTNIFFPCFFPLFCGFFFHHLLSTGDFNFLFLLFVPSHLRLFFLILWEDSFLEELS